jgi:glycosyltransferase involved in cell wall biosynthesis
MNILMLAPEPFFQPRGTPISVYFRLKALGDLGHRTRLLTYPLGRDVACPGLTIRRVPNVSGLQKIKIGPSLAKIPLDGLLFLMALGEIARKRYDLIFSHEEAAWFGAALAKVFALPHLYDMHSSLPQQLRNFRFSRSTLLQRIFLWLEGFVLKNSVSVLVICRDLLEYVHKAGFGPKAVLLENFIDFGDFEDRPVAAELVGREKEAVAPHGEKIVLYAGNFEPYQGVPLLLEAFGRVKAEAVLLLVGGTENEHRRLRKKAAEVGVEGRVVFVEKVPPERVPFYIALSDVLVSPRVSGTNTPLKIYAFLKSGKPLVATNLWTHTQVLTEDIAVLAAPDPASLARGLEFALKSEEAQGRARAARELSVREYIYPRYLEKMREALERAVSPGGKSGF